MSGNVAQYAINSDWNHFGKSQQFSEKKCVPIPAS